nr:immunoglobulin heavy chain junction region [Mus musculus]NSM08051.1 immunoglobulin heavy chain junction region [Mus musculus]
CARWGYDGVFDYW